MQADTIEHESPDTNRYNSLRTRADRTGINSADFRCVPAINCIGVYRFLVPRHKDLAGATETEETQDCVPKQYKFEGPGHAGRVFR